MTTPPYAELCAATRREGTALVSAGRLGVDVAVPTCGDWDLARLLRHVGRVYHYASWVLVERATADPGRPAPPPPDLDPVEYCQDALEEVVDALVSVSPDTPVWNWSTQPQQAAFWARRMAVESAVHRWDAQHAHGYPQHVEPDLAEDGIDELFEVLLPRALERSPVEGLHGSLAAEVAEGGTAWLLRAADGGVAAVRGSAPADVVVRGGPSDLLLVLYGRLPLSAVTVAGDPELAERFREALRV